MNERIKKLWLEALRSGEYKQTKNYLRTGDGFCCLGVLCDLHSRETGHDWDEVDGSYLYNIDDDSQTLPDDVKLWAGLNENNPQPQLADDNLATLNDQKEMTFGEIASLIEAGL